MKEPGDAKEWTASILKTDSEQSGQKTWTSPEKDMIIEAPVKSEG